MIPQSDFMVAATVIPERMAALKTLLATMNRPGAPGMADPQNTLLPFGEFGTLHFARFVIVDDQTLGDLALAGHPLPQFDVTLAFIGDCDGPADECLATLAESTAASEGLRQIFSHCAGFDAGTDLLAWMRQHAHRAAASYVNWIGRTVQQAHAEAALRAALRQELVRYAESHPHAGDNPRRVRDHLVRFAEQHPELVPAEPPPPTGWRIRNALHFAIVPFLLILSWALAIPAFVCLPVLSLWIVAPFAVLAVLTFLWLVRIAPATFALLAALGLMLLPLAILCPPLIVLVLLFLIVLRCYEKNEPEVIPRPTHAHDNELADQEDHDVSNQFTVIGSVKPSAFRRTLLAIILWLTNYGARHVYNRGHLGRIQTIHFARWVFVDDKRRVLFLSNYDGNRQAYMDDFINKVGWGLNIIFGNGFGYPRTRWMIFDGAKNELRFKDTNRRHQIPTQVWYKAYPGLTAFDLARNTRVREGLRQHGMSDDAIRAWLREL